MIDKYLPYAFCLGVLVIQSWVTASYIFNKQLSEAKALAELDRAINVGATRAINPMTMMVLPVLNIGVTVAITAVISIGLLTHLGVM